MTTPRTPTSAGVFRGAPRWAKWAAKDECGICMWYDKRPSLMKSGDAWAPNYWVFKCAVAPNAISGPWRDSLRKRPATKRGKR